MISDFDPRRDPDDLEMGRPTVNSSWLAVIVLVIGVALAGWYVLLSGNGASRQSSQEANSGPAPAAPSTP
jgi:hypothetical protein